MPPGTKSTRPTPGDASRHLRPVLTDWLTRAVRVPAGGRKYTPAAVWRVVLFAAGFARSIAAATRTLPGAPSGQAVWDALRAALPARRRTLERRLRSAFRAPLGTRPRPARVAIDYHQVGYYGRANRDTTRGKGKAGTHTFHTYATACVVGPGGGRYTIGLTAVRDKEPMTDVLTRLLDGVARTPIRVRLVLLDKGFFSVPVMRLLQDRRVPLIIPAVVRGRRPRPGVRANGLRAVRRRPAGRYGYTHTNGRPAVRIRVVVGYKSYRHARSGRRGAKKLVFATWRVGGDPAWVRDVYRTRFGIESSYRQRGQVRARTSTPDGVIRLLWVAIGLLVRNAWVWFRPSEGRGWTLDVARLILMADAIRTTDDHPPPLPSGPPIKTTKPPT